MLLRMTASPPFVILSAAKNLFSCLKSTVLKILRRSAPQNDRAGKLLLRMTERGNAPACIRTMGAAAAKRQLPPCGFQFNYAV